MFRIVFISVCALLAISTSAAAQTEKRVALIIGNSQYLHTMRLANPANDAQDLSKAFQQAGFETTLATDVDIAGMQRVLRDFAAKTAEADVAVIYYAGHGLEFSGENYLIPTDAQLTSSSDIDFETVRLNLLVRVVDRAKRFRLIILDASRSNPLKLDRAGSRQVARGLTPIDPGADLLVAYSARAGTTAEDGAGRNSPFASALLKHLATSDLEISLFFRRVRDDVLRATGGRQEPFVYGSLSSTEFYLNSSRIAVPKARGRRVALVLAVDGYTHLSPLHNPKRDAAAIATLLQKHGFEVSLKNDLPRAETLDALEEFKQKAKGADTGLVYYAGHGMEVGGRNIVAPKDAQLDCEHKEVRRVVDLNDLIDAVSVAQRRIVLLDACRNDPIPGCSRATFAGGGFRSFSDVRVGGMLLANSTVAGALASDGIKGEHSPFAKSLLQRLAEAPQTYFRDVLETVAADVAQNTGNAQLPEIITRGAAPRDCLSGARCGEVLQSVNR